jgi:LuxR family maltose regulon positive regulatory protein
MPSRAARAALPAKLTPPQLQGALPRERLFSWLDRHASAGAVWISGAPGAGKTVLAASWVETRGWARIW